MRRRDFTKKLGYSSLALSAIPHLGNSQSRKLKLLVLGGTNYLGPAIVEIALNNGHEITLFNRGVTNPDLFPEIEKLRG